MAAAMLNKAKVRAAIEEKIKGLEADRKEYMAVKASIKKREDAAVLKWQKKVAAAVSVEELLELRGNVYGDSKVEPTKEEKKVLDKYRQFYYRGIDSMEGFDKEIEKYRAAIRELDLYEGESIPASGNLKYLELLRG